VRKENQLVRDENSLNSGRGLNGAIDSKDGNKKTNIVGKGGDRGTKADKTYWEEGEKGMWGGGKRDSGTVPDCCNLTIKKSSFELTKNIKKKEKASNETRGRGGTLSPARPMQMGLVKKKAPMCEIRRGSEGGRGKGLKGGGWGEKSLLGQDMLPVFKG